MELPKKLQQTRDDNAPTFNTEPEGTFDVHDTEMWKDGFNWGADAVLREAEKLVEALHDMNTWDDAQRIYTIDKALTDWRSFIGTGDI